MTKEDILSNLDHCLEKDNWQFITLNHPYIYTIDSRINVFRNGTDHWAIAAEVLGYVPRGEALQLQILYFGNSLINLDLYQGKPINEYIIFPCDFEAAPCTDGGEYLNPNTYYWPVRGGHIEVSHNPQDYLKAGIKLQQPGLIGVEEVARLLIAKHSDLFRATDKELYKSIPDSLKKILVIDQWYHREFELSPTPFDNPDFLKRFDLEDPYIQQMIKSEKEKNEKWNRKQWNKNRPGSYETWQQIAEVIATGDVCLYKPTRKPNSHWRNWPESGSM